MAEEESKWNWRAIFGAVALAIFAAVLGGLVTYWFGVYSNRLRHITYYAVVSNSLVSKPDLGDKQLQILVAGIPVDNVSQVSIYVQNNTDEDFENVPIKVSFPQTKLISKVIKEPYYGVDEQTTTPRPLPGATGLNDWLYTGSTYTIKVLNRSDKPTLRVDYLFEGPTAPAADVSLQIKGADIQKGDFGQKSEASSSIFDLLLSMGSAIIALFGLTASWAASRAVARLRGRLDEQKTVAAALPRHS